MTAIAPAPGSAEWLAYMTASKVSAVVGTSAYESRFSLWHRMAGNLPPEPDSDIFRRGHYLEPAIAAWWADQHPEWSVIDGGWHTHAAVPTFAATPDRRLIRRTDAGPERSALECKSANNTWEWGKSGEPGTPATITPGYYDQVQWQMFILGIDFMFVAVLVAMEFREYRVERDHARIELLVDEALIFMASLADREPPSITDGSTSTYEAIRHLHPDINGEDVEIPVRLAKAWLTAKGRAAAWSAKEAAAKNKIAGLMGDAKRARCGKYALFGRQSRGGGTPFLKAANTLPEPGDLT